MKKEQLIEEVKNTAGLETKAQAEKAVDAVFGTITGALKSGEEVNISGFGKFVVKERKERQGVNPRTGEKITIAAGKKLKFRAGKDLKEAIGRIGTE